MIFRQDARRKLTVLGTLCFALFMTMLDGTIVNVALPTIDRDLNAGVSGLQWVADAYTLALATCLLMGGTLGDRFGRRRMFLIGLTVFVVGSLGSGLAPSIWLLVGARALQGVGAAILLPTTLSILAIVFSDPRERTLAISIWAGVSGIALAAGPLLGGLLIAAATWRTVFFVNVPIGILGLAVAVRTLPVTPRVAARIDVWGQACAILGLGGVTYALIAGDAAGWTSPRIVVAFVTGAVVLAAFVVVELRRKRPMLDLRMFRSKTIATAHFVRVLVGFSLFGSLFFGSLFFQQVLGYTPLQAGVRWVPMTVAIAVAASLSGRLSGTLGARVVVGAGLTTGALGLFLFSSVTAGASYGAFWWHMVLIGIGLGLAIAPLTAVVLNAVPTDRAGMASASVSAAQQIGAVLGVALLGVVVTGRFDSVVRSELSASRLSAASVSALEQAVSSHALNVDAVGLSEPPSVQALMDTGFVDGMQSGLRVAAGCTAVGAVLALIGLPRKPRPTSASAPAPDVVLEPTRGIEAHSLFDATEQPCARCHCRDLDRCGGSTAPSPFLAGPL